MITPEPLLQLNEKMDKLSVALENSNSRDISKSHASFNKSAILNKTNYNDNESMTSSKKASTVDKQAEIQR